MPVEVEFLPAEVDLKFKRGDRVILPFTINDVNLQGGTSVCQIRAAENRDSTLIGTFDVTLTNDGADTDVELDLPVAENTDYVGEFYWDLQIALGSAPRTYMAGRCHIVPDVSHTS